MYSAQCTDTESEYILLHVCVQTTDRHKGYGNNITINLAAMVVQVLLLKNVCSVVEAVLRSRRNYFGVQVVTGEGQSLFDIESNLNSR